MFRCSPKPKSLKIISSQTNNQDSTMSKVIGNNKPSFLVSCLLDVGQDSFGISLKLTSTDAQQAAVVISIILVLFGINMGQNE